MINKRYLIDKKLGQGRSKVFSVIDTEFPEREVAAKFLPFNSSNEEKDFFREEFFTLQKLDHPNIIKSFEMSLVLTKDDEDNELEVYSPFITLEHFSSSELLQYSGLKDERKLVQIVKQICSALYYLHQSNYIYYDLKPENILVEDIDGKPFIKIIDLGLSQYILMEYELAIKGTAYYIAPELLKNEMHDHSVDFYSLGMMLYRIVYDSFPFKSDDQLEIYKAHIEEEFVFPESDCSEKLINVIKKLVKKSPVERYSNALQIIDDLGLEIDLNFTKDIIPAKVFSDRKDAYNILTTYLKDNKSNEVFTVRGFDGSGKSSLLLEINEKNPLSVLVENTKTKSGIDAIKYVFRKIIFSETLYSEIHSNFDKILADLFNSGNINFIDNIKQILNNLPQGVELILLLDDFNLYDEFTKEVLIEIIPILQIKRAKIILSESSDYDHFGSRLSNLCDIQLNQFTDHQISEFLDLSYSVNFPKRELKKFILLYADLLPGNIKQFIKDLIILKIMKFGADSVSFSASEDIVLALQSSHEEMYRLRLSNLNTIELKLAQIISAFEISIEQTILAALLDIPQSELKLVLIELEKKNIIQHLNISNVPQINSFGFNKYIYSTISNKIKFHIVLANSIKRLFPDFNTVELARQFELANENERSFEVLKKEIGRAEEISAYSYKKSLLEKLLKLSLPLAITNQLRLDLVKTLYKLSDYKSALDNIYKLQIDKVSDIERNQVYFIKGSSLMGLRKIEEGKKALDELRTGINDQKLEQKILIELAYAEFDLNNFESAEELCKQIISDENLSAEDKGKCYNLFGIIAFQYRNNSTEALKRFNEALNSYQLANIPERLVKIQVNIGNIYYVLGKREKAEEYWNKALLINQNIGNLEQEAYVLLNYGVYHQENLKYEMAIQNWINSETIFGTIGQQNGRALSINNLGEIYLQTCDYQNSYDYLNKALQIFKELNNKEEEINTLFLLGKFWFIVGDYDELEKVISKYEYNLYTEDNLSERFQINHEYLKFMKNGLDVKVSPDTREILKLIKKCNEIGELNLYVEMLILYVQFLINAQKFDESLKYLNDKILTKQIENNIMLKAQREYLFGKIAQLSRNENLKSPINYFENAYSIMEDQSINELTWKILFTMAETFWERGNIHKAKKPRIYATELLNMIADHITNNKIRNAYIERVDRKQAFEKLKFMSNPTQVNEYQKS
jgi:serine/threonine protein kinase